MEIKLYNDDCFNIFPEIPDGSIHLVLVDPPYGTTACKWDTVLDLERMWKELNRIVKPNAGMLFTGSQPFTSILVMSNIKNFRCEWIWQKAVGSNFATTRYQPMKEHESVLVFGFQSPNYFPVMQERSGNEKGKSRKVCHKPRKEKDVEIFHGKKGFTRDRLTRSYGELRNPSSVQYFQNRNKQDRGLHPTQKPVALMEYLIKTYSNEGDVVLDFCMGSGTTGVACKNSNREFIGIEKEEKYYEIAKQRINNDL